MKIKDLILSITVLLISIVLLPTWIFAQTGKIEGKVIDSHSGRELTGANVIVEGTTIGSATGVDGRYFIIAIPAGEYKLTVSMIGYKKITKKVKVRAGQTTTVNFKLQETVLKGDLVVVTATKTKHLLKDVPVPTNVITGREIEAANIQTIQHALRYLSGIQVNESYSWGDNGKVELQGLDEKHTLILVDGQRVCGGHRDAIDLQAYSVEMVDRIEIVKGPASCLYGSDAVGGVINIISKSAPPKFTFSISPTFGTHNTQIYKITHGFGKSKIGYFINYTHRESDGINKQIDEYREDIAQGTIDQKLTTNSKLTVKSYYSLHKMKESDRKQKRYSLNSIWNWIPDKASNLKLRGSWFNYHHSIIDQGKRVGWKETTYELELDYSRLIKNKQLVTTGYHYLAKAQDDEMKNFTGSQTIHSFYLQDEINLKPVTFVLGTRLDKHNRWGVEINPKASFLWQVSDNFRLRGSVGRAFKGPSLVKLYAEGWRMGPFLMHANPDLKPEKSIGYQFGAEWKISADVLSDFSFFRNEVKDMVGFQYSRRGRPPWDFYYYNIGEVRTQGIELNLASQIMDNLSGKLGYTFLNTEDKITGKELTYKPKHTLYFEFDWKISGLGLGINLNGRYIGKRYKDEENTQELSDYALANLSITQNITRYGQVYLRIDNLFNKKAVEDAYCIDGTEFLGGLKVSY